MIYLNPDFLSLPHLQDSEDLGYFSQTAQILLENEAPN
jgi:hypothetical protein